MFPWPTDGRRHSASDHQGKSYRGIALEDSLFIIADIHRMPMCQDQQM